MSSGVLGIDIGGTLLRAALVDASGDILGEAVRRTGRSVSPSSLVDLVADATSEAGGDDSASAVGIGYPGLVPRIDGPPAGSVILPAIGRYDLRQAVSDRLGLPCSIDNDVNCAALAESDARGGADMLFVSVGTGVGGALVLGGGVWRGDRGLAGEIGHLTVVVDGAPCICGRRGCLNAYASGTSIEIVLDLDSGTLELLDADDDAANAALALGGRFLGIAIGNVVNVVDVSLVVVGGGVSGSGERFIGPVRDGFGEVAMPGAVEGTSIEIAELGWRAGMLGAAALARASVSSGA